MSELGDLALVFARILCVSVFLIRQNQHITPGYWFFSGTRCDWCACATARLLVAVSGKNCYCTTYYLPNVPILED